MTVHETKFSMLINGKMVDGEGTFDVINPSTEKPFAQVPECSQAQAEESIQAAATAFKTWQAVDLKERKALMQKVLDVVKKEENVDLLAKLIVQEQGKTLAAAKIEAGGISWLIERAVNIVNEPETYSETDDRIIQLHRRPVGVMACITAWNFPLFLAVQKWAPAIVLGNTVVWKPSPYTPTSPLKLAEMIAEVLPPGVFNVVTAKDDGSVASSNIGKFLTSHPQVAKVSFTGSGPTGKAIMKACAPEVKRFNLELGGNDCAIVRGDVDIPETAKKVFAAAFGLSGQVCVAVKRVLVHESIFEEFQTEMVKLAEAAKIGDGFGEGVEYGPLSNKMQLEKVKGIVEDAKANGAKIRCGGEAYGPGYFYKFTIVSDVKEGLTLWDEEQFGPVLPLMSFKDDAEAIQKANNSKFGLGGSVWSKDTAVANDMAAKMLAGTVWVNQHTDITGAPFGGFKQSGIGRELGKADVDAFTEMQTLSLAK